jgi:serine/threonine protein kinase
MIPSVLDTFKMQCPYGIRADDVIRMVRISPHGAKDGLCIAAQLATVLGYVHSRSLAHVDLHHGLIMLTSMLPETLVSGRAALEIMLGKTKSRLPLPIR